jgi:GTP cyclohydrolase I
MLKEESEMDIVPLFKELFPFYDWEGDPELADTPARWQKMMKELTTPQSFEFTTFENPGYDEMIVVQDISFTSVCAHHLAPFVGKAHVAYVPTKTIAGLSKLPRTVEYFSAGLWTQEALTNTISNFLEEQLDPLGVAVIMRGEHTCMSLRGVKAHGTLTTTSSMRGCFADHTKQARSEFLSLIS